MQEYLIAFAVGGTICALSQLLMDKTKLMPGRIMVILVVTGVVLGAFGIYEPFKEWAGAGASVPLLGFGNTLWKGVKKAVDEEGLLGIFKGGLTASSAGICAALVFGLGKHFSHRLRHPQALVANDEFHAVQATATQPLEEADPTGLVLFHALSGT